MEENMVRLIHALKRAAAGAAIVSLMCLGARAEERFSELRLDQLTPEQQKMAINLKTPPRNSAINSGPFKTHPRSPGLGLLLLPDRDYVGFNSSQPQRLSEFATIIGARQCSQPYQWRAHC